MSSRSALFRPASQQDTAAAQATADAAVADAADAQATADTAASAAAAAQTLAAAAQPADAWPSTSGNFTIITARPHMTVAAAASFAKDTWRATRFLLTEAKTIAGLAVVTTAAAAVGTAVLRFGIWTPSVAGGRPSTRTSDWSSLATIDLTQTPGTLVALTPGLILPAGEHYLGCAWAGTATGAPSVVLHTGHAPFTDSSASGASGYSYAVSGLSAPDPFVPAAAAASGVAIYAKLP